MKLGALMLVTISMLGVTASGAGAADSIYWANYDGVATISSANLDGSGSGRDLFTGTAPRGGTVSAPAGLALDPAAGTAYWSNSSNPSITRGNLDGCDAAAVCATNLYPFVAGGPPVAGPGGPAIDVANGLMYWMNATGVLVRASLDGSGTVNDTVNTTGATALGGGGSGGLAIDTRTNRIYWTNDNFAAGTISWANLDGSGGGDLNTTGANMGRPWGLALDLPGNRVYWTNYTGAGGDGSVSWASLDGTGGGDLYTSASPGCSVMSGGNGIAVDRAANKVYWANFATDAIASANLDGSGGCVALSTAGATLSGPDEVAVLKSPVAETASTLTRAAKSYVFTCTAGSWSKDSPEAFVFRAPRTVAYQWTNKGVAVPGANAATFTPTAAGSYACAAVATNNAGSTASQASAAIAFKRTVTFKTPKFKRKISKGKLVLTGKVSPSVKPSVSSKDCKGTVGLKFKLKTRTIASKKFALKYKMGKCSAAATVRIAKKYAGKKVKLTISISRSTTLTTKPRRVSVKL